VTRRHVAERGSASVWVVTCCALLMVVAGVATIRGLAVLARHRAESAADLAALAAAGRIGVADDECAAAARIARRNSARVLSCRLRLAPDGRSGTVFISIGLTARLPAVGIRRVVATARAAREPGTELP
jgi:secretion/DNA translocation related TadE-like protein